MTRNNDIGLIGLAVMGQNLALNIARNGFGITVYNRTGATTREFMDRAGRNAGITATDNLGDLAASLARPRKIICMVKAGPPVDAVIEELAAILEAGDLIMDGGNALPRHSCRVPCWKKKACTIWASVFPAGRRAPCAARQLCPAARPRPGTWWRPS